MQAGCHTNVDSWEDVHELEVLISVMLVLVSALALLARRGPSVLLEAEGTQGLRVMRRNSKFPSESRQ